MDAFNSGWTFEAVPGTGVQIARNRDIGASDLVTDDGFGNLVPASAGLVIYFLTQEH